MAEKKDISLEQQRRSLCENVWLSYFNSCLYKKGLITESERNRMISKIERRKGFIYRKEY